MTESLFLVTSAIHAKFGVFSTEQRLEQTVNTLKSVKKYCDADIILLEAGSDSLSNEERELLKEYVINILDFTSLPFVKEIQKETDWDFVKNLLELIMLKSTFAMLDSNPSYAAYSRIFKLSGRYVLNNSFNYEKHLSCKGKIAIKTALPSIYKDEHWVMQEEVVEYYKQYMARLWSFDRQLLPNILSAFEEMHNEFAFRAQSQGRLIDIEHLMFRYLNPELIEHIDLIGVNGNIAPNGLIISD
jgi:archaellum biogenesis ATPase FlaH